MSVYKEMQAHIASLKELIAVSDATERLMHQPDFQLVFLNHLYKELPLKLMDKMSNYKLGNDEHNALVSQLDHVSYIKSYLNTLIDQGQIAQAALKEAQAIPDSELI